VTKNRNDADWRLQMAMLAVENIHESIYWLDIDGRILYVNPAAERELGYSADELLHMRVSDIDPNVPPEMWGKDGEISRMLAAGGGGLHNMQTQHRHRDGHLIPVEINSGAFNHGGEQYSMAICRDISERLAAEQALLREKEEQAELIRKLEETQGQLLQSEKLAAIGQLAAGVAHEINNPMGFIRSNLATLRGYAENLFEVVRAYEEAEPLLPEDHAVRDRIARAKHNADFSYLAEDMGGLIAESIDGADRVRRIVQDLRHFSRDGNSEWQRVDLHACLESTVNMVSSKIKNKAELVRDYGTLPPVECIPSQLEQVFVNLLVNAAQAIPEQGRIVISTRCRGDMVEIAFADTGQGIHVDALPKVFDPFFTTKPVGKGTGLGLSVSYGIVKKHGGNIEVVSEPGRTVFTISLPIERIGNPQNP
jgi:two-component system, NtrC family, sensor kinase